MNDLRDDMSGISNISDVSDMSDMSDMSAMNKISETTDAAGICNTETSTAAGICNNVHSDICNISNIKAANDSFDACSIDNADKYAADKAAAGSEVSGGADNYFRYGAAEINYLKSRDPEMAAVIDRIGYVYRGVDTDLFSAVVHQIVGQQISTRALETVWQRMLCALKTVSADNILDYGIPGLQALGMTFKKAEYITDFARKLHSGEFDIEAVRRMDDDSLIRTLSSLKGIGVWTAEMIMIFCLERPNVLSFGDLAIHRGLRMIYGHKEIDKELFEMYRRRFSPYCSTASLYIWAVSGGALPELTDPAPPVKRVRAKKIQNASRQLQQD